jgi:hypothetical protein
MTPRMHKCIALGPTGNLQGSVKFYCLTTGRVLKRRSFTPMPMPDRVIKRVNAIGVREGQKRTFHFLNQRKEPFEWTDSLPKDDPEFQGLVENEDEAPFLDVSAELPGVVLESEERDFTPITDEPEEDIRDLARAALHNAGIDPDQQIRAAFDAGTGPNTPVLIEAEPDEVKSVYKITFDLPDAGLPMAHDPNLVLGNHNDDTIIPGFVADDTDGQPHYPTRACRSVLMNQPCNAYAPRVAFLQLGTTRAHRSVLEAAQLLQMSKDKRIFATTTSAASTAAPTIDDTIHRYNKIMTTTSE